MPLPFDGKAPARHTTRQTFFSGRSPLRGIGHPHLGARPVMAGGCDSSLSVPWTLDARQKTPEPIEREGCPQAPVSEDFLVGR